METERLVLDEKLLEKVEAAAREGARQGAQESPKKRYFLLSFFGFLIRYITPLLIVGLSIFLILKLGNIQNNIGELFNREESIENHDLTLDNRGILGYTVADFQDAILGDSHQLKKLEVYTTEVSDLATITETGLGNFKVFTKCQYITYHGTATYTVDLSKLTKADIVVNDNTQAVTLYIPHTELEPINIPSEKIEFGDVKRGILAIGKMNISPEQMATVQTAAKGKMVDRLNESDVSEEADRFAKLSVWEMYQPAITGVASGYSLTVEFDDG